MPIARVWMEEKQTITPEAILKAQICEEGWEVLWYGQPPRWERPVGSRICVPARHRRSMAEYANYIFYLHSLPAGRRLERKRWAHRSLSRLARSPAVLLALKSGMMTEVEI